MLKVSKNGIALIITLMLVGCLNHTRFSSLETQVSSDNTNVKTAQIRPNLSVSNPSYYLVKPGDTLYSIAFRFGFDYKKLATANGIDQSFRIYEGQSLALTEKNTVQKTQSVVTQVPKKDTPQNGNKVVTKPNSQKNDGKVVGASNAVGPITSWRWPHNGKIVRTYRSGVSDRKGIDISGRIGDSVSAATNGVVVYAGNGLPGYGNLIILEHANSLLSAYAFNEQLLVKEKDQIKSGQKIATMGKQGDQPGLHFEIRQNGKPVDPQKFLPKR